MDKPSPNMLLAREAAYTKTLELLIADSPNTQEYVIKEILEDAMEEVYHIMCTAGDADMWPFVLLFEKSKYLAMKHFLEQYTLLVVQDLVEEGNIETDGEGNFWSNKKLI